MRDAFGNYLCQKIISTSTLDQINMILSTLYDKLGIICLDNHGTRAVQSIIEKIKESPDLIHVFLSSIYERILDIVLDVHGNHVIQNCIN
jgi:hypothetical protein